jgi:hypothetical protein
VRSETEPVEEADEEWAGSESAEGLFGRSVETEIRARVPKKRRDGFRCGWPWRDELEGGPGVGGGAVRESGGGRRSGLSDCLAERTEAILRMKEGRERERRGISNGQKYKTRMMSGE